MANPGNTGQRYKMSKFEKVEAVPNGLKVTLACGHSYITPNDWPGAIAMFERFIAQGKRTRCNLCIAE